MKKIYMYLISLIALPINLQAQNQFQGVNFGDMSSPVPSLSSLADFSDNPPSLAVGIPEISLPLLSISGYGGLNFDLQLSYNPTDVSPNEAAGEMGTGWFMFKGGVISRQINGTLDEAFQNATSPYYEKNIFDDEYYYSVPGFSGKFKIERDIEQNTFRLVDLTPLNHVKIAYTKQNNTATLVIDSFTITDDEGNTYYFNDYSSAAVYNSFYDTKGLSGLEYKSAFFLTRMTNAGDVEVANFTYQKNTKYDINNTTLLYKNCQLQKINTASGNIEIVYDYDQTLEKTMNDPYSIKKVILNNSYTKVTEYVFDYSYPFPSNPGDVTHKRRQLDKIKKMAGQNSIEETTFLYNPLSLDIQGGLFCEGSQIINPPGVLNKIIYPTKGVTQYIYENAETYVDKNSAAYLESLNLDYIDPCTQNKQEFLNFSFNTNQTLTYSFTIPGDSSKKKTFWVNYGEAYTSVDPNTGEPILLPPVPENKRITYTLKRGTETLTTNQKGSSVKFYNYPGQYTVIANVPQQNGQVNLGLVEVTTKPGPYRNASSSGEKYRIRSIKRYNDINSNTALKTVSYSYDDFSIPNASSGYTSQDGRILFTNVKVMNGSGNGYTKYFFKLDKDYPSYTIPKNGSTANFQPYYNLLRSGILEKKETYSENNQLLGKENYEFTFSIADDADYITNEGYYSKTAFTSQTKNNSLIYPSGSASSFLQTASENNVRSDNYKPSSSKNVSADGTVTESFYKYAQDKNLTLLTASNITGRPVETEVKKNGKTIGKSETKFENVNNKYPSSSIEINPNDGSTKTSIKYDLYDDKGNIVQYTSDIDPLTGKGNFITVIWGYNKTVPIAKITGAKWSDIGALADDIIAKSNADNSAAKEKELIIALDAFRNNNTFEKFQIITYSYDPLIGVTTVTPPTGIREYYIYDVAGRLQSVKNANGNVIKEVKYNNK